MINRYTIGGVAFMVDEVLPDLDTEGFTDATLHARFGEDAASGDMRRVSGPMALTGAIDPSARECTLPFLSADPVDRAWQLRQMAPIFSTALDRLVLHAGAVEIGGTVVAFVGESAAGKSTLARFLARGDHRFVADDLLPVRFDPNPSAPTDDHLLPIGAIAFLRRSATDTVIVKPLAAADALQHLVVHGFGEHGDSALWAFQFDAYHRLADSVPSFNLTVPDDLAALPLVGQAVVDLVDAARAPRAAF